MKGYVALLLLATLILNGQSQGIYKKVIHNTDPQAKCLDGSPGLIYVNQGGDPKNIMIFFLGGGFCGEEGTLEEILQACYQKSMTMFGSSSSKYWPEQMPEQFVQGILSTDPRKSAFANWTKFFLPYCDGALHQGYSDQPILYKDASLYFRGAALTRSNLNWIGTEYNLKGAQKVIMTGMSAGGVAVNTWNNYLRTIVGDPLKIYPISDGTIILNYQTFTGTYIIDKQLQNMYKITSKQEKSPLQECNKHYPGKQWRCLSLQYSYPYIQGDKYMIINSQYDSWVLENFTMVNCVTPGVSGFSLVGCSKQKMEYIEKYRAEYNALVSKVIAVKPQTSLWSISCANHIYTFQNQFYDSPLQKIPTTVGQTVREAVEEFVIRGVRVMRNDTGKWPSNTGCAM